MRYRLLGNSGLRVSEAALGAMTFGDEWGWGSAKDEARKVYDAFREAGGNFIDTANFYTNGTTIARAWSWPRNTPCLLRAQIRTRLVTSARI